MTTLYQFEHSPFCIPIVAIFKALKKPLRKVTIPISDRSKIIKLTEGAYYQVPVLVDGKMVVYESTSSSQDVARYVDALHAGGRLFPPALDGIHHIVLGYIENEVEDVTFKLVDPKYLDSVRDVVTRTMIIRHKERKFGRGCVEEWRKQAVTLRKQAAEKLAPFDQMVQQTRFLLGEQPVYADYLLLGILGNLTYRKYNAIPKELKALAAWEERLRAFRFV
jgi:glutathione S-transferase